MNPLLYWLTQNLSDVPEGNDWLSAREKRLVSGLHFSKRRNDWRLGRWTAKSACRACLPDVLPAMAQMEIIAAEDGGPDVFFVEGKPAPVSLSISHSNDRGFCVVSLHGFAVGCDVERIENQSIDFFDDYFTRDEISFCSQQTESIKPVACYLIWSAKESSMKILREGLRRDTRSIQIQADFPAKEGGWNAWTGHCLVTAKVFQGWWRYEDGFMYALGADRLNREPGELRV